MGSDNEQQEYSSKFINKLLFSIFGLPVVMWIWPWAVPFGFFEFWKVKQGTPWEWLCASWPVFVWGVGLTVVHAYVTNNERGFNRNAEAYFIGGALSSFRAGLFEEVLFRWLFFLGAIVGLRITNYAFFGFLGFGVSEWFYSNFLGPLANFVTLHKIEPFIYHSAGWYVGAAMLATNAFFRDGHRYLGPLGWINSWVIGLFLFWIMFTYGLPAAILVHFVYDFLIDIVMYVDAVIERAFGYA